MIIVSDVFKTNSHGFAIFVTWVIDIEIQVIKLFKNILFPQ